MLLTGLMTGAVGLLGAAAGAVASVVLTDAKRLSLGERTVWAAFGAALSLQGMAPSANPLWYLIDCDTPIHMECGMYFSECAANKLQAPSYPPVEVTFEMSAVLLVQHFTQQGGSRQGSDGGEGPSTGTQLPSQTTW